ncbi:RCC1 domain-containing protein 1-like [Mytilus californianus]|uniref:RCC1 domain-containing protein 1-like n=1 Tax=Mytilus californianus TaxID=6549 RepID=UPI0022457931|nr:RCC1 domain-containing protein 1-like [Mytilus californianus]
MVNVHGFGEFMDDKALKILNEKNVTRIKTSWSNTTVQFDDGTQEVLGYQHAIYDQILHKISGSVIKNLTFVGENLVFVNNFEQFYMITDKSKYFLVQFHDKQQHKGQISHLTATDKDLIIILDTKTCFISENILCKIGKDIRCEDADIIPTLSLPLVPLCTDKVAAVSCGKEHILLLTTYGTVLTFGGGTRGQLGHGTVDSTKEPKLIDSLAGLKMLAVAAGGWHSLCVSECGDIYCWGWNESGQLGLPSNTVREKHGDTHRQDTSTPQIRHNIGNIVINDDNMNKPVQEKSDDSSLPSVGGDILADDSPERQNLDKMESLLFIQNVDPAQIHPLPCLIDLQDTFNIQKASCGSRHTALLTENGILLTSGWNDYGQLCHDDIITRDYFETVSSYIRSGSTIKDVHCGPWSTYIITD